MAGFCCCEPESGSPFIPQAGGHRNLTLNKEHCEAGSLEGQQGPWQWGEAQLTLPETFSEILCVPEVS